MLPKRACLKPPETRAKKAGDYCPISPCPSPHTPPSLPRPHSPVAVAHDSRVFRRRRPGHRWRHTPTAAARRRHRRGRDVALAGAAAHPTWRPPLAMGKKPLTPPRHPTRGVRSETRERSPSRAHHGGEPPAPPSLSPTAEAAEATDPRGCRARRSSGGDVDPPPHCRQADTGGRGPRQA